MQRPPYRDHVVLIPGRHGYETLRFDVNTGNSAIENALETKTIAQPANAYAANYEKGARPFFSPQLPQRKP
jgi:hypothetical protein